ncbi:SMP-30/gluconolactonase/LRE family protein [Bauldia litoralis]|uniref:Gluconolactonase n=1 Tax=Bauldia litoralis TaxID=665467 RepID=A0A1G6EHK7_9HYPH|nr:SMP-30/gluconolactonase/LRE family protein [Bauldia litoralis]SDB56832.1 gluconolactonase [Bauldia litoralis]
MALVGPDAEHYDKRFTWLINGTCKKDVIFDDCRWSEGPVWFRDGNFLVWSDIPNNRMLRWVPDAIGGSGSVSVFRADSNYANGNTRDREGRLMSCEHGARRVTRTEVDGSITVIADSYKGKRLNSPNDVVVKSDGTIWFTDPNYGIMSDYEGHKGEVEQDGCFVFRFDPRSGELAVVADDFDKPNGLAFSPDESELYVADSASAHEPEKPRHIRAFKVNADNTLSGGEARFVLKQGFPDGFRVDTDGNVWTSAGAGVDVFSPEGEVLGRINFPQGVSNLVFGGPKKNRLFVTCTQEVYSVYVTATGAQVP